MELDALDWRVLSQLDIRARAPCSVIARKIRTGKNVVNYRIKNLEKKGVVRGYYAIIDVFKLGYSAYRFYIKLQYADPKVEKEILDSLVSSPRTWWAGSMKGHFNIGAVLWAKDGREALSFWQEFASKYKRHIGETRVCLYHGLDQFHLPFTKSILSEREAPDSIGAGGTGKSCAICRIDKTDAQLLKLLANNARAPLLKLASHLRMTPSAVRYRMRLLEKKGIIVAYRPNVATDMLGLTLYKLDITLNSTQAISQLYDYALLNPFVFYIDRSVGLADVELELYCKSPEEFYCQLEEIRTKFSEHIRDFDFSAYSKIAKISYVPSDL